MIVTCENEAKIETNDKPKATAFIERHEGKGR